MFNKLFSWAFELRFRLRRRKCEVWCVIVMKIDVYHRIGSSFSAQNLRCTRGPSRSFSDILHTASFMEETQKCLRNLRIRYEAEVTCCIAELQVLVRF